MAQRGLARNSLRTLRLSRAGETRRPLLSRMAIWRASDCSVLFGPRHGHERRYWLRVPYESGSSGCMKKTLHIDEHLLREARRACQATTDTETVRLGLEALVQHAAYERLRALRGKEPQARDVPRRRAAPSKHRAA